MEDDSQPSLPTLAPSFATRNQRLGFSQPPPAHLFTDSSEPAAFSSDDDPALENYAHHGRRKKRRIGSWFHQSSVQQFSSDPPFPEFAEGVASSRPKAISAGAPRQLKRDMDSGVWLAPDETGDEKSDPAQLPAARGASPMAVPRVANGFLRCASIRNITPEESLAQNIIQRRIEEGIEDVDISGLGLKKIAASTIQPLTGFQLIPTVVQDVPFEARDVKLKLYLGSNRLTRIPASISDLSFLTVLSLRGNGLRELPAGISRLRNLEQLNIAQNALRWLPHELLELITTNQKLEILSLHPNPYCYPESTGAPLYTPESFNEKEEEATAVWSTFSGVSDTRGGFLVARSPVQYIDGLGQPCNTHVINLDEGGQVPNADPYAEPAGPPAAFDHAPLTRARSLLELALESCSQASTGTSKDLRSLMPDQSPAHLLEMLDRVDQLRDAGPQYCAQPLCSRRRAMIIPRTQWLDWWVLGKYRVVDYEGDLETVRSDLDCSVVEGSGYDLVLETFERKPVPFMSKGCSWRCVPKASENKMPTPACRSIKASSASADSY